MKYVGNCLSVQSINPQSASDISLIFPVCLLAWNFIFFNRHLCRCWLYSCIQWKNCVDDFTVILHTLMHLFAYLMVILHSVKEMYCFESNHGDLHLCACFVGKFTHTDTPLHIFLLLLFLHLLFSFSNSCLMAGVSDIFENVCYCSSVILKRKGTTKVCDFSPTNRD